MNVVVQAIKFSGGSTFELQPLQSAGRLPQCARFAALTFSHRPSVSMTNMLFRLVRPLQYHSVPGIVNVLVLCNAMPVSFVSKRLKLWACYMEGLPLKPLLHCTTGNAMFRCLASILHVHCTVHFGMFR